MIGLILVTHGALAEEFIHAMEHVVGRQTDVIGVCIGPNDDMEKRRKEIADAIKRVDSGEGVIILTDLFGADLDAIRRFCCRWPKRLLSALHIEEQTICVSVD